MTYDNPPLVAQWYRHLDKGQEFQVTVVDEDEGTIAIQHFDGDLEEIEIEAWYQMDIEAIEPPEDWTGPVDDIETDDLGYSDDAMDRDDWEKPLREEGSEFGEEESED